MPRRIDKIEKDMGYCEIKLEKEKRLRKQLDFIDADLQGLNELLAILRKHEPDPASRDLCEKPSRESFLAAGLLELEEERRELLEREREDLRAKLQHFEGFGDKKRLLDEEKRSLIRSVSAARSTKLRQINDRFKKTERVWNELTEDLINLDEAIFLVGRNLDYLRSCRNFLISAKGNYDFEGVRPSGCLTDVFRHSYVGRAAEMADGADRNLQAAHKEVVCVSSFRIKPEAFIRVLGSFMEALYDDLFEEERLRRSIEVIEASLTGNLKLLDTLKTKREAYGEKLEQTERERNELFSRFGSRRGEAVL